jgi:hypothetical protein
MLVGSLALCITDDDFGIGYTLNAVLTAPAIFATRTIDKLHEIDPFSRETISGVTEPIVDHTERSTMGDVRGELEEERTVVEFLYLYCLAHGVETHE